MGLWGVRAPCAVRVLGRLAAAFIPSGVPAAGCCGGMGRVRVRAAGSIRQPAGPPGAGPVKPAITRCPRPGLLTRPAQGSYRVAEFLGRILLPGPRRLYPGRLLRLWPKPLVAAPGGRPVLRPGRTRKSPEGAQTSPQPAPSSGLCDWGRKPSLSKASPRWCHTACTTGSLARQLPSGVWPCVPRATGSRAGRKANPSAAAGLAADSYGLAGLPDGGQHAGPRYLLAGWLLRPRSGSLVDTSSVWPSARLSWPCVSLEHAQAPSLPAPPSGLRDGRREPSLVKLRPRCR